LDKNSFDIDGLFNNMKEELSPKLKQLEGRGGWHSIEMLGEKHNNAPVIRINIYNSAADTDLNYYYRLDIDGIVQSASQWSVDTGKDLNWTNKNSKWDEVNKFFDTIKNVSGEQLTAEEQLKKDGNDRIKDCGV
jgi:hypothetical protein